MTRSNNDRSADALALACGLTTDVFFDSDPHHASVQWIWAVPIDRLVHGQHDGGAVLRALADRAQRLGFRAQTTPSTHRVLSNGSGHEPACPFARDSCVGAHLVVTGSGRLHHGKLMSAAQILGSFAPHATRQTA